MRLLVRCSGTWVFLWLLKLLFSEFYFIFFVSLNFSFFSDLILIVIFSRTYIFFGFSFFFSDFRILLRLVNFFFSDLYVFPNLFFLRTSNCLAKICVRKNTSLNKKIKSEKQHKKVRKNTSLRNGILNFASNLYFLLDLKFFSNVLNFFYDLQFVARRIDFKNNQNKPKLFKFSSFPQGIRLQNGSQVKPIASGLREDLAQFISPTKVQLSSVARQLDFKQDQNKPKFL